MKRSRDYSRRIERSLFCSAGGQERRGVNGGGEEEKKASAVRGRIGGTHEIIMVHIKCNLAKRMQRCIEARVEILRAVPSLCLFLVAALAHTLARARVRCTTPFTRGGDLLRSSCWYTLDRASIRHPVIILGNNRQLVGGASSLTRLVGAR